ncbi:MAG: hypothetical protein KJP05_09860, partial [Deltaproteobacteria bacterium]|nr:hypothetical protein [Deltaproteobacteria bacterium]
DSMVRTTIYDFGGGDGRCVSHLVNAYQLAAAGRGKKFRWFSRLTEHLILYAQSRRFCPAPTSGIMLSRAESGD